MKPALFTVALIFSSVPALAAGSYCIDVPSLRSARVPGVPGLPGYGRAEDQAPASKAAIDDCSSRSPFGSGASCRTSGCYAAQ